MITLGQAYFDANEGRIFDSDNHELPLRSQSRSVLKLLANRSGEIVSKSEIFDEIWQDRSVTDDSLVQCVADIRRAIGPGAHDVLETIPTRGYRLNPSQNSVRISKRRRAAAALFLVLVLTIPTLWWLWSGEDEQSQESAFQLLDPGILLLPFEVADGQQLAELHATGLQLEIAGELGRHRHLRVLAPLVVQDGTADSLVEQTNAQMLLSGALEEKDDVLSATVHLRDIGSNEVLWSETWVSPREEIFSMRDAILKKVTASLVTTWTGDLVAELRSKARTRPSTDYSAYENFLIGSFYKHDFSLEGYAAARSYLEKSVEIDPDFGRGWVALFFLNNLEGMSAISQARRKELRDMSRYNARRALEVAPEEPWSLVVGSVLETDAGNPEKAAEMLKRAVALAPSDADLLAVAALGAGKETSLRDLPIEWVTRAYDLNPHPPPYYAHASAFVAFAHGDYQKTLDLLATDTLVPSNVLYALAAADRLGNDAEVERLAESFKDLAAEGATVAEILETQATGPAQTKAIIDSARAAGLP